MTVAKEPFARPLHYDAVIFDLDGVVTDSARLHASAWKALFDGYLRDRTAREGGSFRPFGLDDDYAAFVDGRPRYDGVRSFLASRGIELPDGSPADGPGEETVCGLGNRKDRLFADALREDGAVIFPSTVLLIRELEDCGIRRGVASSSKNCLAVLRIAGLAGAFDARVDGAVAADLGLRGKPAPDIFLECARSLGTEPRRAVVVEDAISGVQAGSVGGFALVCGIARSGNGGELLEHGADVTVPDLEKVTPRTIDSWCAARRERDLVR